MIWRFATVRQLETSSTMLNAGFTCERFETKERSFVVFKMGVNDGAYGKADTILNGCKLSLVTKAGEEAMRSGRGKRLRSEEVSSVARVGLGVTFSIVQSLGRAIASGAYSATNPLPTEDELAKRYGVGRNSLREAVKIIASKGLIGARSRKGIYIRPEQDWNYLDTDVLSWIFDCRNSRGFLRELAQVVVAIEPKAAAMAARYANDEQRITIRRALLRIAVSDIGEDDLSAATIEFHKALLFASGNRLYAQLAFIAETTIRLVDRLDAGTPTTPRVPGHKKVWDAIVARDEAQAESAARCLIEELLLKILGAEELAPNEPMNRSAPLAGNLP